MFNEDDVKRAAQLGQFLLKAKLNVTVAEWIEFNRLLVWYNGMVKKIHEHVHEVKEIILPPQESKKLKSK